MKKAPLGQCFLNNIDAALNAVHSLDVKSSDHILEIGGGDGALTQYLVQENFGLIKIVELDKYYWEILTTNYSHIPNVEVINANVLDMNFEELGVNSILGAIPYYITSPIVHKILRSSPLIKKFTLIIQKEVAEKIIYKKDTGLSYWNLISFFYDIHIVQTLPPLFFTPAPKVFSATISCTLNTEKYELFINTFKSFDKLSKFGHLLFLNPRKMLHKTFDKDFLEKAKIDPNLRPHQLTFDQAIYLYQQIQSDNLLNTE